MLIRESHINPALLTFENSCKRTRRKSFLRWEIFSVWRRIARDREKGTQRRKDARRTRRSIPRLGCRGGASSEKGHRSGDKSVGTWNMIAFARLIREKRRKKRKRKKEGKKDWHILRYDRFIGIRPTYPNIFPVFI